MGDEALSQMDAWGVYDAWRKDRRVVFIDEPDGLERRFRSLARSTHAASKAWADAYLAAFAEASQLTLVTFDRALRRKTSSVMLLEA